MELTEGIFESHASHGNWVTVAAPRVDIPVAVGDGYRRWSGSSFACAMLAGTIALMLKQNPKLEAARIRDILRSVGPEVAPGLRLLDASDAVQRAIDSRSNPPRKPVQRVAAPPRAPQTRGPRPRIALQIATTRITSGDATR